MRRATPITFRHCTTYLFLSTLSLRRATYPVRGQRPSWGISIHALLAESDRQDKHHPNREKEFLSTLSLRRATSANCSCHSVRPDFYPRSPCGERLLLFHAACFALPISIHALLAESDVIREPTAARNDKFLSTLSLRRATRLWTILYSCPGNFYPRSPCGERHDVIAVMTDAQSISIHALLAESDPKLLSISIFIHAFLSTLSLRRATHH